MAFDPRSGSAEIPPQFRPTEESLRLGEAFGLLGFADADVLQPVQEPAVATSEDAPVTPDNHGTDIHGNDIAAVGAVTDHARKVEETIGGYVHLANVTGGEVNQSLIISDARLTQGGDGGDARNRREQRRAQQQVTDQVLLAQMEYHQQMADQIGDYLAEGNFAVGADGRLENEEMEQQLREYERRNGLPEGSIDRHDADAVRDALEDQEEWHRTQAAEAGQRLSAARDISADLDAGASVSEAVAGQSTEVTDDAAWQESQDNPEGASDILEATGHTERESTRVVADSAAFADALAGNGNPLFSQDQPDQEDVAALTPVEEERVGPVITPEFRVASIGDEGPPEGPAPTSDNDAPPPFPGFG